MTTKIRLNAILAFVGLVWASPAIAYAATEDVAAFYKGRQVRLIIGLAAGEAYDVYARLLARHMAKYIPGSPKIVPQNQPGAGSLNAINSLYNTASRDGRTIGTGHRFIPMMPLLNIEGARFDPLKFSYIGSMNREIGVCVALKKAGFRTVEDMRAREFIVGTTGLGAELTNFTTTLRSMLGVKLKLITGYRTSGDINAAIDRGELQGRCGVSYSGLKTTRLHWIENKEVDFQLQLGLTREKELPDVPMLTELVASAEDRQALELMLAPSEMGRPFLGPPGIPPDRLAALRAAFDASMRDEALLQEADRLRLEISPLGGADIQALISRLYKAPAPVVARANALVHAGE